MRRWTSIAGNLFAMVLPDRDQTDGNFLHNIRIGTTVHVEAAFVLKCRGIREIDPSIYSFLSFAMLSSERRSVFSRRWL